ncbi:MAG: conjugal transfer protein TraN, partial [Candidatus Thioglobus sp.]
ITNSINKSKDALPAESDPKKEKGYYSNPAAISGDAAVVAQKDDNIKNISTDAFSRPKMEININSDAIKQSQLVQENATAISNGTYKDCTKHIFHKDTYVNKTCTKANSLDYNCSKILNVSVVVPQTPVPCLNILKLNDSDNPPDGAKLLGEVTWYTRHFWFRYLNKVLYYSVPSKNDFCLLPNSFLLNKGSGSVSGNVKINANLNVVAHTEVIVGNSTSSVMTLTHEKEIRKANNDNDVVFRSGNQDANYNIEVTNTGYVDPVASASYVNVIRNTPPLISRTWSDTCAKDMPLLKSGSCQLQGKVCTDTTPSKMINGIKVASSCWRQESAYHCGTSNVDTCSPYKKQGCQQIATKCSSHANGMCSAFSETWSCKTKQTAGDALVCANSIYCLDGSCQKIDDQQNKDFADGVTKLSSVSSGAEDVKKQAAKGGATPSTIRMFTGRPAECRDMTLGIMNCCNDTGWAKGIITHCNDQEKDLGENKEKGDLVVYTGTYCHTKHLWWCWEHRKSYCIFPSRIAYDVQVDGRGKQLHRGFGGGGNPDCSGITADEMEKLNFNKIDFSDISSTIAKNSKAKLPNHDSQSNEVQQRIKKMISNGIPDD